MLFIVPTGCSDIDAPSWERCVTALGLPAWSFEDWGLDILNAVTPFAIGGLAGLVTWFSLKRSKREEPR